MTTINVSWLTSPRPGNFGDLLSPYILSKYGYDVNFVHWNNISQADAICVGSIARLAIKGTTVLGSGIISKNDVLNPDATWLWVRGPHTKSRVIECGGSCSDIFGDPALLLPRIFPGSVNKIHKVGIVPHHIDYELVKSMYPNFEVINLLSSNIEQVILDITNCELILSSSLHGLITANAYGIPAAWVKFNKLVGDDTKFYDYYESVGITPTLSTVESPKYMSPGIYTNHIHQVLLDKKFLKSSTL